MDPKILKEMFDKKKASEAAVAARAKSQRDSQEAALRQRQKEMHTVINQVVIPYLQRVSAELGQTEFTYGIGMRANGFDLGFWFRIGQGHSHGVELRGSEVMAWTLDDLHKGSQFIPKVFSPNNFGSFAGPSDLTPEKIGELIRSVIEGPKQIPF